MKKQVEADKDVASLVEIMQCTFDTVNTLDADVQQDKPLKDLLTTFTKQSLECAVFIKLYTRRGFVGEPTFELHMMYPVLMNHLTRPYCTTAFRNFDKD